MLFLRLIPAMARRYLSLISHSEYHFKRRWVIIPKYPPLNSFLGGQRGVDRALWPCCPQPPWRAADGPVLLIVSCYTAARQQGAKGNEGQHLVR